MISNQPFLASQMLADRTRRVAADFEGSRNARLVRMARRSANPEPLAPATKARTWLRRRAAAPVAPPVNQASCNPAQ